MLLWRFLVLLAVLALVAAIVRRRVRQAAPPRQLDERHDPVEDADFDEVGPKDE